jgi:hypothetical protein
MKRTPGRCVGTGHYVWLFGLASFGFWPEDDGGLWGIWASARGGMIILSCFLVGRLAGLLWREGDGRTGFCARLVEITRCELTCCVIGG